MGEGLKESWLDNIISGKFALKFHQENQPSVRETVTRGSAHRRLVFFPTLRVPSAIRHTAPLSLLLHTPDLSLPYVYRVSQGHPIIRHCEYRVFYVCIT